MHDCRGRHQSLFSPTKSLCHQGRCLPFTLCQCLNIPAFQAPAYAPPCAPRPVGFLAGYAPLLMLDMSGTMHPSKGGRFFDMKVVSTLLHMLLLLLILV